MTLRQTTNEPGVAVMNAYSSAFQWSTIKLHIFIFFYTVERAHAVYGFMSVCSETHEYFCEHRSSDQASFKVKSCNFGEDNEKEVSDSAPTFHFNYDALFGPAFFLSFHCQLSM